ncbi:hypothetical protein SASPL_121408 [Salvia splendens]|uniref:O-fucosyltransferase family protein n=1 Tax=Salvia splendens TaxID=180675 RepID=A0A8X8XU97_SALSN|nr:hypothetical protein SASPL_121408 [Salvia splendens]
MSYSNSTEINIVDGGDEDRGNDFGFGQWIFDRNSISSRMSQSSPRDSSGSPSSSANGYFDFKKTKVSKRKAWYLNRTTIGLGILVGLFFLMNFWMLRRIQEPGRVRGNIKLKPLKSNATTVFIRRFRVLVPLTVCSEIRHGELKRASRRVQNLIVNVEELQKLGRGEKPQKTIYARLLAKAAHALAEGETKEPKDLWMEPYTRASSWIPCSQTRNWEPSEGASGFIMVTANGGINQQRVAVCNAVAIARMLNATLVLPRFMFSSVWRDASGFESVSRKLGFKEIRVSAAARSTIPTLLFRHCSTLPKLFFVLLYRATLPKLGFTVLLLYSAQIWLLFFSAKIRVSATAALLCPTDALPKLGCNYYPVSATSATVAIVVLQLLLCYICYYNPASATSATVATTALQLLLCYICYYYYPASATSATVATTALQLLHCSTVATPFSDIYQEDYFIDYLKPDIRVVKELPLELQSLDLEAMGSMVTDSDITKEAKPSFYMKYILPILHLNRVVHFVGFGNRLASDPVPHKLQRMRQNDTGLGHLDHYLVGPFAQTTVKGQKTAAAKKSRYLALHLRFEIDMVAHSLCEFGGGEEEKRELEAYRGIHFPALVELEKKGKFPSPTELKSEGLCPLMPEETVLMLAGLGFNRRTHIYLAGAHIYGGNSRLSALTTLFPNLVTKENLLSSTEIDPFRDFSSRLAALDFIACTAADVFAMTDSGRAKLNQSGFTLTITPLGGSTVCSANSVSLLISIRKSAQKSKKIRVQGPRPSRINKASPKTKQGSWVYRVGSKTLSHYRITVVVMLGSRGAKSAT